MTAASEVVSGDSATVHQTPTTITTNTKDDENQLPPIVVDNDIVLNGDAADKTDPADSDDLDFVFNEIGEWNIYQLWKYALIFFPIALSAAYAISFVATGTTLDYRLVSLVKRCSRWECVLCVCAPRVFYGTVFVLLRWGLQVLSLAFVNISDCILCSAITTRAFMTLSWRVNDGRIGVNCICSALCHMHGRNRDDKGFVNLDWFFFVVLSCSTNQKLVPCHNRHTRKIEILSINSRVQRRCVRQHCKWFTRSYTTENVYKCWPHARCLSVCLRRQVPHTTYIHTYICNAHTVASGLHTRVCARGYCIGIWVAMATWESKQNSMTASQSRTSTWTTTHRLIEWHKLSHVARCVMDLFIMVLAATNGRPRGQFLLIDCGQMECMIGCDATHSTRLRSIFL